EQVFGQRRHRQGRRTQHQKHAEQEVGAGTVAQGGARRGRHVVQQAPTRGHALTSRARSRVTCQLARAPSTSASVASSPRANSPTSKLVACTVSGAKRSSRARTATTRCQVLCRALLAWTVSLNCCGAATRAYS